MYSIIMNRDNWSITFIQLYITDLNYAFALTYRLKMPIFVTFDTPFIQSRTDWTVP